MNTIPPIPHRATAAVVLALCATQPACSFMMVQRLPSGHRAEETPRCSASSGPMYVDIGSGLLMAAQASVAYSIDTEENDALTPGGKFVVATLGSVVLLHAVSAYYAIHQRDRCETARAMHDAVLAGHGGAR